MRNDDSPPPPESASSVSPDRRWLTRRSTLAVAVAALAPACLAGWVLTHVLTGAGPDGAKPRLAPLPASHTAPGTAHGGGDAKPSTASPSADSASSSAAASASASASASAAAPAPAKGPLAGRTVVIDPGHNTGNFKHTEEIDKQVDIGTNRKECDTTGTTTNSGYMEAEFSLDVSRRTRSLLEAKGVKVVFTHEADRPWGPCIDERARIGNEANADAVVSVHADGASAGNRGYHIILPAKVKAGAADTAKIVGPSRELGERIAGNFARSTGSVPANYLGGGTGLVVRDDLGGLNLSTRPKVFIECGNMRDAKDAAQLTSPEWRQKAAEGIANGVVGFLGG
ncbi:MULTISPECIES: N-acetylmuramoyl-L-alanine amidase [unclassified Streptomyces]|uniref:N-acetylmuramoyl-L-alanine amidase n=1 Tax=unclassified Streptomyces TaxID=2593676 RepID=UPI001BECB554|nr:MULTISPECIES: N-acetylmuramoyl-L-alanine amidase [unclassified Streptomyces]MBT2403570.1 N-acetylmuramoyl-L-alanine amidase [Streptomyces sp. ISL-21]MBT2609953.1 N-acetylmuramoyl-L-alanine amidase [Streptomyces sp. ISL-87]